MAKIICLFNHKGGVSKTTTTFNLGWMLANKEKRVLLADFDPQCNLTGMVMGYKGVDDLEASYTDRPANNIKAALAPAFESQPRMIEGADCLQVPGNDNLYLLPGHIGLSEYDTTLGVAQELSGSLLPLRNLPGSIHYLLVETAAKYDVDIVLVDMSPSLSPLNQNLLTTSDHFIVPLHPDYFSSMALSSLASTLPKWQSWAKLAYSLDVLRSADYPFPEPKASFIGAIVQKYRPRNGKATSAFQKWIDRLEEGLETNLIPILEHAGMISIDNFNKKLNICPWTPIMEVADFNGIIALSQEFQTPVYRLQKEKIGQKGAVWDQTAKSMQTFEDAFSLCADRVLKMIE